MKKYFKNLYGFSKLDYFKYLEDLIVKNKKKFIITMNPETVMYATKNKEIAKILLDKKNSITPDGIAVVKKAKKYKIDVRERIAGIDIATELLQLCDKYKKCIYLFGSKEEVINDLVKVINNNYKNVKIIGYSHGYVEDKDKVFEDIVKTKPDVCLVALGIPHQELLINKHINKFDKGIFVGVGGSFDVLSGHKKRAPKIFIKLNLEWLYRIICEPKRLKRFFQNNILFMLKK